MWICFVVVWIVFLSFGCGVLVFVSMVMFVLLVVVCSVMVSLILWFLFDIRMVFLVRVMGFFL